MIAALSVQAKESDLKKRLPPTQTYHPLPHPPPSFPPPTQTNTQARSRAEVLTKTVVAIVGQIESIVTSAAIIAWYVVALVYAAAIIVQITFINV